MLGRAGWFQAVRAVFGNAGLRLASEFALGRHFGFPSCDAVTITPDGNLSEAGRIHDWGV